MIIESEEKIGRLTEDMSLEMIKRKTKLKACSKIYIENVVCRRKGRNAAEKNSYLWTDLEEYCGLHVSLFIFIE